MKNVLKLLPFFLMVSLLAFSCSKDDDAPEEEEEQPCVTDPAVTVEENIIGTWKIDGDATETVTFMNNGTGSATEGAFHFTTSNDGKEYPDFTWEMEGDDVVKVTYDYGMDTPVVPFVISENYTVTSNACDQIEMESGFGSELTLRK